MPRRYRRKYRRRRSVGFKKRRTFRRRRSYSGYGGNKFWVDPRENEKLTKRISSAVPIALLSKFTAANYAGWSYAAKTTAVKLLCNGPRDLKSAFLANQGAQEFTDLFQAVFGRTEANFLAVYPSPTPTDLYTVARKVRAKIASQLISPANNLAGNPNYQRNVY